MADPTQSINLPRISLSKFPRSARMDPTPRWLRWALRCCGARKNDGQKHRGTSQGRFLLYPGREVWREKRKNMKNPTEKNICPSKAWHIVRAADLIKGASGLSMSYLELEFPLLPLPLRHLSLRWSGHLPRMEENKWWENDLPNLSRNYPLKMLPSRLSRRS